jgi:carbon monoxide dehydrogenase subunit G
MKMTLNGTEHIGVSRADVYTFLTNPDQVGRCLPDLQELQVQDPTHFVAIVKIGVGAIRGKFKMEVELQPDAATMAMGMRLKGSGMGSMLNMTSQVQLQEAGPAATDMVWSAEATVSGPLASVGGRLLEGQAKKTTQQLFETIRLRLEAGSAAATS